MKKIVLSISLLASLLITSNVYSKEKSMNLNELKNFIKGGEWISITTELRPQEDRTGSGKIAPFYVSRNFQYFDNEKFKGTIISYADPTAKLPLVKFEFLGHLEWKGEHEVAKGAQKIDYVLDEGFKVTPLNKMFSDMLNKFTVEGLNKWEENKTQDILMKEFPLFNIKKGEIVKDHDLIYIFNDMLFMGSKHVDGRGFDKPENRPELLQIPLYRKKN
ncbi:MAG: hypothetical protein U0457_17200 [Candidatus Sericytochromatia bacterium]